MVCIDIETPDNIAYQDRKSRKGFLFFALISGILKSFCGVVSNEERLSPERNKPAANSRIVSK